MLISMIAIGFAATIIMVAGQAKKTPKEHRTTQSIVIMAGGIFCNLAVLLIMFVVLVSTYGQGV